MNQPFTFAHRERIVATLTRLRVPAMYGHREAVESGGLISYAVSVPATFRRAAYFVDRIFRGATAAQLPVEQPTAFELVVNLRTAKALGLSIPPSVQMQADETLR
jgi:putative ABC transport system substrate-binding protein